MRAGDFEGELAAVRRVVSTLPGALAEWVAARRWPIVSVLLDGSFVRGDFWPGVSDVDVTVTLEAASCAAEAETEIQRLLDDHARTFSSRPAGRKPLRFDVQTQTLDEVTRAARRPVEEWTADNVPPGYPKLWLYAFDGIRHHAVLYGEDMTERYTRLSPAAFVPIRLTRLGRAVAATGDGIPEYDRAHGTITQMKNVWEIMRAVHLARGGSSIAKSDVVAAFEKMALSESLQRGVRRVVECYRTGIVPHPDGEAGFRRDLHSLACALFAWHGREA